MYKMEPENFHQLHQLQEQFAECFTSATQSVYKGSTTHDWNPSVVLNDSNYHSYLPESVPNSRELWRKYPIENPLFRPSMYQESSFCYAKTTQQSPNELFLAKLKEEMPDTIPKLSEIIYSPFDAEESHSVSTKHEQQCSPNMCENLCLGNFSPGSQTGRQPSVVDLYSNDHRNPARFGGLAGSSRYNFNHVFPCFSPSDLSSPLSSHSLGLNLQTLDLLTSTNNRGNFSQSSDESLGFRRGSVSTLSPDPMHELSDSPSNSSSKNTTAFMNEIPRRKRPNSTSEPKECHAEAKKSRSVSRCSCPPLKVRKEKLGDRIAALQKLVAPFGKTDTASVLTEAIGYIQFLHDQIQTLSMPYKSSHNKPIRAMQTGLNKEGREARPDLKSRGLCLLPQSSIPYIRGLD
ncbi:hypothetical protein CJ030_MR8G004531 [Morella rubra]|uniref:BHLH domain-containing protein n=1 Tax=Morella rubra TaxID=262757 RepID=A0A6A1UQ75_9ROSI|nr:hypothetical protein CJ030_MR8G004531 [Morella rubra]